ncbi:MAG TPA: trypsin-like serine protease [Kineosporiaceae bacterium]
MTASSARLPVRGRIPSRVRVGVVAVGVAVLAVAATAAVTVPRAVAVPQSRGGEPFMAGTDMRGTSMRCTAGLVLMDNSVLGGTTEYRRSVRFVLTAGHCGQVGDRFVTVPEGNVVGDVVWKSPTHDLLLIRVEPRLDRGVDPGCLPGSWTLPCVAVSAHYYPRAVGRVFTGGPQQSESVPVGGTTQSGVPICISGGVSGTICGHTSAPPPTDYPPDPPDARDRAFTAGSVGTQPGDSGAPLYSFNGNVFGIATGIYGEIMDDGSSSIRGVRYTPVSVFFAETSGYAPAPPG